MTHKWRMKRAKMVGEYMLETKCTIRKAATDFGLNKNTVWQDIHKILRDVDREKYEAVVKLLEYHKSIRHLRGGYATHLKWEKMDNK